MGRGFARRRHRASPAVGAVLVASAAVLLAAGGDVHPYGVPDGVKDVVIQTAAASQSTLCCLEFVESAVHPAGSWSWLHGADSALAQPLPADRWRVVERDSSAEFPAAGFSEHGLQVQTILTARALSELFPEINGIGGYRADALRWHPEGLAIDVMVPNWHTVEGKEVGDQIVAFVMANAERLGIQHAIWRGVFYSHDSTRGVPHGLGDKHGDHYDHVHIATFGGGYPTGHDVYWR